jgi:hypothetical protein
LKKRPRSGLADGLDVSTSHVCGVFVALFRRFNHLIASRFRVVSLLFRRRVLFRDQPLWGRREVCHIRRAKVRSHRHTQREVITTSVEPSGQLVLYRFGDREHRRCTALQLGDH